MMDETTDIDVEDVITEYDRETIDADALYDLREDAEMIGATELAARIEIERRSAAVYDTYWPKFTQGELLDIGMLLMRAKEVHYRAGRESEVERVQSLAESFLDGFDFDDDVAVQIEDVDELPTVDEVTDE